ncbi:DUF4386 domain-containing protein [Dyella japonica]|uniref:DUF4386 family protein n=1 Tax=Dyella japonica DSM 16301 TaxID=1440762 RepID=A0A0G9H6X0_9GAMM|nr:DUF4386 domain-containing protein [Dyella japonica]KLD63447.1 hypothetical protein Y882_11815 [Dyella japonica DSM 16301]
MPVRIAEASPRLRARITGLVYLLYFLTAIAAEVVVGRGRQLAYAAVTLLAYAFYVALTLLLYRMFKPVHARLSLLAAVFSLVGCAIEVLGVFLPAFRGVLPLAFFGPYCLLIGYLIVRSNFLPRFLGVLMMLAGLGWLIFLTPLASQWSSYLKGLGFVAELLLCLWLMVVGVRVPHGQEKTRGHILE